MRGTALPPGARRHVDTWLATRGHKQRVRSFTATSASAFHSTALVQLEPQGQLFVKEGADPVVFRTEARALEALARGGATVPAGATAYLDPPMLVMEAVPPGARREDFEVQLAQMLANLHRNATQTEFGLSEDNFLGATPQQNSRMKSWPDFFRSRRLAPQLRLARGLDRGLDALGEALLDRVGNRLDGPAPRPRLIHGDLWSGNVLCNEAGSPVLIDPAAYYGHREAEFGMTTLFGNFTETFYDAYRECFPLDPGAEDRIAIYRLYHLLNHVNLFGASYIRPTLDLLKRIA